MTLALMNTCSSSVTWKDVFEVISVSVSTKITQKYDFLACEAQYLMVRDRIRIFSPPLRFSYKLNLLMSKALRDLLESKVDYKAEIGDDVTLSHDDWLRLTTLPTILSLLDAISNCESSSIGIFVRLNQAEQLYECLMECGASGIFPPIKIADARQVHPPHMGRLWQIHDLPLHISDLVRREIDFHPDVDEPLSDFGSEEEKPKVRMWKHSLGPFPCD